MNFCKAAAIILAATSLIGLITTPSSSQTRDIQQNLEACASIANDDTRLGCYDKLSKPVNIQKSEASGYEGVDLLAFEVNKANYIGKRVRLSGLAWANGIFYMLGRNRMDSGAVVIDAINIPADVKRTLIQSCGSVDCGGVTLDARVVPAPAYLGKAGLIAERIQNSN